VALVRAASDTLGIDLHKAVSELLLHRLPHTGQRLGAVPLMNSGFTVPVGAPCMGTSEIQPPQDLVDLVAAVAGDF